MRIDLSCPAEILAAARPEKDSPICAAIGDGGNVIYADHKNHISVGVTGTFKPRIFDRIEFIEKKVIPMISHCS